MLDDRPMFTRIARWELDIDPVLTAQCYARYVMDQRCDCTDCRNFRAAGDGAFPPQFRGLASRLGVDLTKPSELCHYGQAGQPCPTGGWFHVVGALLSGRDAWKQVGANSWHGDTEPDFGLDGLGFTNRIALLPEAFKGHPVVQLEFQTTVPWVLGD